MLVSPPRLWTRLLLTVVVTAFAMTGQALVSPYESFDGTNNNTANPSWGAADAELLRGASGAHYADGISSMGGVGRPSPRAISNALFSQLTSVPSTVDHSDYIWTWGQFLDHDFGLTPGVVEAEPVTVPTGDPIFGVPTLPFNRSIFNPATGTTTANPRQQINLISAYIDGNTVYGSNLSPFAAPDRPSWLRTHVGGRLKTTSAAVGDLLPYNDGTIPNAGSPEAPDTSPEFFVAGDIRVNEQPTLAVIQTLFVREHNYQAARLAAENPSLSDEELYQQARRIVIAEIQAITYEEFVPALLGAGALHPDGSYDPNVNAGIAQVFSTAAYRLGHTLLSTSIQQIDAYGVSMPFTLRDMFFRPTPPLLNAEGIEPILRGLAAQRAQDLDIRVIDDVRNFLFANEPPFPGLDLVSLNIQRGRDHGLPDFNTVRVDFGLEPKTFSQITANASVAASLQALYGTATNIDLFAGLLAEDDLPGKIVGETLQAILADQFERSRAGDRFFYTHALSGQELARIRTTRLSDIIKRNTSIRDIQQNVFFVRARGN